MADERREDRPGRRPRKRTWLRRLTVTLAVGVAVLGAGLFYITRPERLANLVERAIEGFSQVDAEIDSAILRWDGELTLRGLRLSVPGVRADVARLLDAEQVTLNPAVGALLRARLEADAIVLREPVLYLTEDVDLGRYNLQMLPQRGGRRFQLPDRLPEIFVSRGQLRFAEIEGGQFRALEELALDGTLTQSADLRGVYGFVLRQERPGQDPLTLRGLLDLAGRRVGAQLEHFRIDDPQRNLLPRRIRDWWDRLQPQGSLPRIDVAFDADPAVGLHATIELARAGLRLPYGDLAPQLSEVDARIVVVRDTITIQKLVGSFEGTRYSIEGTIRGFAEDAAFELTARTQEFTLTTEPAFIAHLPAKLRKHYDRFSPAGTGWIEASAKRAERGGPVAYAGVLHVVKGSGRYFKFPYPMENVRGQIGFSDERVTIDLSGESPSGGTLELRGRVEPPTDGASVDITVTATGIAVDDHLTDAMEPKHRKVMDLFLNRGAYDDLRRRGVVRAGGDASAAAPIFELGGRVDATVHIVRPFGREVKWEVTTTIDTTGASILMEPWPYPLRSEGGTIVISPEVVLLHDVKARGLSGGGAVVRGRIDDPGKGNRADIELDGVRLPMDDLLLASLPVKQGEWIRRLGVAGTLVGQGRVFNDAEGEIDFELRTVLADGALRVLDDALVLHDFTGSLAIRRESLTLDAFSGSQGDTRLGVSGRVGWGDGQLQADARLSAANLDFTPALIQVLPEDHPARPKLDGLMAKWNPAGRVDGELDYRTAGPEAQEEFTLTVQPRSVALDLRGERVAFPGVTGTAVVRPTYTDLRDLSVAVEGGRATVSGRIDYGRGTDLALRIAAEGASCGPQARTLLPPPVVDVIDGLQLDGRYRLAGSLVTRERPRTGVRELEFDGVVTLDDASADLGVPVTGLDGRLAINAIKRDDAPWPLLDLRLDASQVRVLDRLVRPLSLHLANAAAQPDLLRVEAMHGEVYGGTIIGEGSIGLDEPGTYRLDVALDSVDVEPMLYPLDERFAAFAVDPVAGTLTSASGKLSASLSLEAERGESSSRRGRGAMEVRDARLYDRPLTMAILQATTLSLPMHQSFDRASARYVVDGDTVVFDLFRMESPTVVIAGGGTLDFPTRELDLTLVTRGATGPDLGPLSDLLHALKDELIGIRVTGKLDAPEAGLLGLEALRSTWTGLFTAPEPAPRREARVVE